LLVRLGRMKREPGPYPEVLGVHPLRGRATLALGKRVVEL
jgi:hypothetical protein